jgi:hypothetical protein
MTSKLILLSLFLVACGGSESVSFPNNGNFTIDEDTPEVYEDINPPDNTDKIPCYHSQWDACNPAPTKLDVLSNPVRDNNE